MKITIIVTIALILVSVSIFGINQSRKGTNVTKFTNASGNCSVSTSAPFFVLSSGVLELLYEGEAPDGGKIELRTNYGRDIDYFEVEPGYFSGLVEMPEAWVDNATVTFSPASASPYTIKLGLFCGTSSRQGFEYWRDSLQQRSR